MVAWTAYQATEDYANTKRWAGHGATDGSLWASFERGWLAAGGRAAFSAAPPPAVAPAEMEAEGDLLAWKRPAPADTPPDIQVGDVVWQADEGFREIATKAEAQICREIIADEIETVWRIIWTRPKGGTT